MKNKKLDINLMLFLLFCIITLTFTVGYSALNQDLSISGEAVYRVEADIRVTNFSLIETTNGGIQDYSKYSKDSITGGVTLLNLDSTLTYEIEITNYGNVAMYIDNIDKVWNNENILINISGYNEKETIYPGQTKVITGVFKYNDNVTVLPDSKTVNGILTFSFKQPESILAMGNTGNESTTFFNGTVTKESIEIIKFANTLEVGEDALDSWDASLNKDGGVIAWYTDIDNNNLYELTIGGMGKVIFPEDSKNLFGYFTNLKSIDFNNIDTSNAINMSSMFYRCSSLMSLDLSNFDTTKVTTMRSMFFNCSKLTSLDLSNFKTSYELENMYLMFYGCNSLTSLDLSNFKTSSKLKNMGGAFSECNSLMNLIFNSQFNTSGVTIMEGMFSNCSELTSLNLSMFDASNVTNMQSMFFNCSKLTSLDLSNFKTSYELENMYLMFYGCNSLTSLDLSNFKTSNKLKNMGGAFRGCSSLTSLIFSSQFNTSGVTIMEGMFYNCTNLKNLNLSMFDTSKVTTMKAMFSQCKNLESLNLSNFDFSQVVNDSISYENIFNNTGKTNDILIYVKDEAAYNFVKNARSSFTNVQVAPLA